MLAESPLCESLTRLDMSFNPTGDAGLAALCDSPALARLKHLRLYRCGLSPRAAETLLASPFIDRLAFLDLSGNDIGFPAFDALRERLGDRFDLDRYLYMDVPDSELRDRLRSQPPRCVRGLGPNSDTELLRRLKLSLGYEYVGASFELTHPDPTQRAVLLGFENPAGYYYGPFAIRWEPSGETREFYDAEQHGGYAERDANDTISGTGERTEWSCGNPGCRDHRFIASFGHRSGYSPTRFHDRHVPFADQFFHFYLDAYCAAQGRLIRIASFSDK